MVNNVVLMDPFSDPRWDSFVASHPSGWLTHLSGWTELLEGTFKRMKGYHLALLDATKHEIRAALPVFLVKNLFTGSRLVSVPLGTLCGPLVTEPEDLEQLVDSLLLLSEEVGASSLELRTYGEISGLSDERLGESNYFKHHCLLLTPGPEELKKSFHRSCVRQKIERAVNSGLKLKIGAEETDLRLFYRLHVTMRKRLGLPPQPYAFFEMLWKTFSPKGEVELLLAQDGASTPAGLMLFKYNGRVSAEILANDESVSEKSPNHFLFWEAIKRGCAEKYTVFDFGRTSPDNETLMAFKGRWGTQVQEMPTYYHPGTLNSSERSESKSVCRSLVRNLCRKTPEKVLGLAGNLYYRVVM